MLKMSTLELRYFFKYNIPMLSHDTCCQSSSYNSLFMIDCEHCKRVEIVLFPQTSSYLECCIRSKIINFILSISEVWKNVCVFHAFFKVWTASGRKEIARNYFWQNFRIRYVPQNFAEDNSLLSLFSCSQSTLEKRLKTHICSFESHWT